MTARKRPHVIAKPAGEGDVLTPFVSREAHGLRWTDAQYDRYAWRAGVALRTMRRALMAMVDSIDRAERAYATTVPPSARERAIAGWHMMMDVAGTMPAIRRAAAAMLTLIVMALPLAITRTAAERRAVARLERTLR